MPTPFADVPLLEVIERYCEVNQNVQAERTRNSYATLHRHLTRYLGRPPTTADLDEETVGRYFRWREGQRGQQGRALARGTINNDGCNLLALWKWCAVRRLAGPPTIKPPPRVVKSPRALTLRQLRTLFRTAEKTELLVNFADGSVYWPALLSVLWQTGERVGAVMALAWDDVDLSAGWIHFAADSRKFRRQSLSRPIDRGAVSRLRRLRGIAPHVPFNIMNTTRTLYVAWHKLTAEAGLPTWVTPHTIRKSVATHLPTLSDATEMLDHSSSEITRRNYIDPTIRDGRKLLAKLPDITG